MLPGKTEAEAFLFRHVVSGREAEGALPHSAGGYSMVMARRDFQANCSGSNSASTHSLLCNLVGDFVPIPQSSSCKMGQGRCLLRGLLGGLYSFPLAVTRNDHKCGCLRQQKCILSQVCRLEAPNQGVGRAMLLLKALGKDLPCLFLISGGSRQSSYSLVYSCFTPISASIFIRLLCLFLGVSSPLLIRILLTGLRRHPTLVRPCL